LLKKRVVVLLMVVMMLAMSAAPAPANPFDTIHGGCKGFGHHISNVAHHHRMGDLARGYASGPDSYPGKMALYIHLQKEETCHLR
jgi:galactose mutarotase-like enzyme